jgi:hypothetical protein
MADGMDELVEALRGIGVDQEAAQVLDTLRSLPVVLRAALAAVALGAADKPVNALSVSKAAGYSRGTAYRHNSDALEVVLRAAPSVASALIGRADAGQTIAGLAATLQERDRIIAGLRSELRSAAAERDLALSYARDLHEQLAPEYEQIIRDRRQKVRALRSVTTDDSMSEPEAPC